MNKENKQFPREAYIKKINSVKIMKTFPYTPQILASLTYSNNFNSCLSCLLHA